jgi:hypothetical protein
MLSMTPLDGHPPLTNFDPCMLAPCGRIADATATEIYLALSAIEVARPAWFRLDGEPKTRKGAV